MAEWAQEAGGGPETPSGAGFVHLRVRSAYSLLEGAIKAGEIGGMAAAAGMPAVGIADRANLFGALEFSSSLKDLGVQPIIGCALPVSGLAKTPGGRPGWRARAPVVVLLAQDEAGWANLMALSSLAYTESAADAEPAVAWREVEARGDGLICLSGGPDGAADSLFAAGKAKEGAAVLARLQAVFADRFYVELQRHGAPAEAAAEPGLVDWAYANDAPLVATNDVHFGSADMASAHEALLCIADGTFMGQADRRKLTAEHRFRSAAEMRAVFADLPEACDNTLDIAQRCAFLVQKRDPILPRFPTEAGRTEAEELAHQAREGLKARLEALRASGVGLAADEAAYWARLERETDVIVRMGFSGYFLIVSDFIKWSKDNGVPVGPGRGSGAGSLVAWALTVTNLDPLRFGLLFERFLNPERVSMPDFDIDFCQETRERVIAYVQGKYGRDRVAQIITFGTLQARVALRDVGRVMQLPLGLVDRLAKMVPNNPANPVTLAKAIAMEPRLQEAQAADPAVAKVFDTALKLEGLYRNASTHAAGVVIGDRPLTELVPLYQDPRSDLPATQYNMKWVESAGLVKFDFLGLKTLTVLDRAMKHMGKRGAAVDLDALPLDDAKTYALLSTGQAVGVFQLESQGMRDTLRKLKCGSIDEITALISLYRPGPMDNIDTYVARKFGAAIDYLHPTLEPVLKETYGVIIYQEQVMQIAQILAGYSLGEADLLRRAMGKKKKEEMDLQKARFISGASEKGVLPKQADAIFELVAKFAGYGFNKSHAAAYALIAYQTGWLKANAPVEFFAASMSLDASNTDKLAVFYQDARRFGVKVRAPDVNRSGADFEVEGGEVLYALGAVRNVGVEAMRTVVEARDRGGPFRDLYDFAERIDPRVVSKRVLENLARAGAFDALEPNRAKVVAAADALHGHAQALASERADGQANMFGDVGGGRPRLPNPSRWTAEQQLDEELAAIGFYLTGHPLEAMVEVLRRKRITLYAEAAAQAQAEGREAFRMAGVVRRRQERPSQSGEKFAFVSMSDPTGEYEVLFPPDALKKHREALEVGASVVIRARAKTQGGELRLFGDDAEPLARLVAEASAGLRVHVSPQSADVEALKARLSPAVGERGGELSLIAALGGGREVEVKLPGRYRLDGAVRSAIKSAPGVMMLEEA